jgi:gamma-butyrobetaine dioxygenase
MDGAQVDAVVVEDNGLTVKLPEAGPAYFNAWWLRDNCPTSFDPETRERTFDIFHHETSPAPGRCEDRRRRPGDPLGGRGPCLAAIR